ncbi:MAG TPA: alanine racemase [Perlabentimonas sp.]|nr:alanine racemase [Bacteroidales bacterium]MDD4673743.1 alanine racemase [Bacteroidales bacterium]MDY0348944.1 alanine racemase [Tenuifilaceae bacterium]HZJ73511.1 alanine racemase [Perlabentimonas sp.]
MDQTSYIEISKSAYNHNIKYLRNTIGSDIRFSSVVKGNAYGHGVDIIVPLAEKAKINHFSVFSASEALDVFNAASPKSDIMIMGYLSDDQLAWAIEKNIEFYIFNVERLQKAIDLAKAIKKPARIHIEVETGFNRTGIEYENMSEVVNLITDNQKHLILEGLCTHYAGAESVTNYYRIINQIKDYRRFYQYLTRHNLKPRFRHTAGSAASLTYPQTIMDMVRIGISQYGFWPTKETYIYQFKRNQAKDSDLKRVITWKTRVMSIKEVDPGEFVGYGSSFMANKTMKVAIIPVGYTNGFSRSLSNMGRVLIRGKRVPVVGTVTMNTMSVNVTDIPNVEIGDEVVLVGKQKRLAISIASFSEMSNQLNYQTLARLPSNIPRHVVY